MICRAESDSITPKSLLSTRCGLSVKSALCEITFGKQSPPVQSFRKIAHESSRESLSKGE